MAVIEALCAAGVRDVVLAPGSRSAPLALAVATAEREGRIRLHVRVDERSAGYLALGIAKGSGVPAAVITTSGTAAVNVHPAVVEASYGGVPLVVITADRPPRLRGVGANQTIAQAELFGGECRYAIDRTTPDAAADAAAVATAIAAATNQRHPGPVHLNIALEEPLVSAEADSQTAQSMISRDDHAHSSPALVDDEVGRHGDDMVDSPRGVIVVGDTAGFPEAAADPALIEGLAASTGWPVISEPSGNASLVAQSLRHGPLVAGDEGFLADHIPDVVVTIGRIGLHRSVMRLVGRAKHHMVVDPRPVGYACDPLRTADRVVDVIPRVSTVVDPNWERAWRETDDRWVRHLDDIWGHDANEVLDGVEVVRRVVASLTEGDNLVIGPSWPVRHASAFAGPIRARVFANRGTSGIDGVISTAWGIACSTDEFTVAIIGDLTSIYDRNGLLSAPGEQRPDLAYVVIDNDGGGIFGELEQADPAFAIDYERVFGTPHGADIASLLSAPGVEVAGISSSWELTNALARARDVGGVHVIVALAQDRASQVRRLQTLTEGDR